MGKQTLISQITKSFVMTGLTTILLSTGASAVTQYEHSGKPFLYDITTFKTNINVPIKKTVENVVISKEQIETRLVRSKEDKRIEPLSVIIGPQDKQLVEIAERLAKVGREDELIVAMRKAWEKSEPMKKGSVSRTVVIDETMYPLISSERYGRFYSKTHQNITIPAKTLNKDLKMKRRLLKQLKGFLTVKERNQIRKKLNHNKDLIVDKDLLPAFARGMVGGYINYRGPNCFHAALAFQSADYTGSSLVNVKQEPDYHRAMINYDELWRALNRNFYPVDPDTTPLEYGDMLVFFDVPKNYEEGQAIDFKWIRHAATHLFNGYTFSKGSKSPNTPYTVRTISDEWNTWKRFTTNLGVKVFRKSKRSIRKLPPRERADWIY